MEFNIKWWRLNNSTENGFRGQELDVFSAITVTGFSDAERQGIKEFCDAIGRLRVTNVKTFDEDIASSRIQSIPNSDGVSSFHYTEREFAVYGPESNISHLEEYLFNTAPRHLETFVHGLSSSNIRKICNGSNHRMIKGFDGAAGDEMFVVSIGDKKAYLELFLRSPQGILQ